MSTPKEGHISFASARAGQAAALRAAIERLSGEVAARAAGEWFHGAGPVFVAIGASHAAACAPTWTLRTRGVHAWRLSAGDHPLPFPRSVHPLVAVSQSGRSSETLAVLESVEPWLRYSVTNVAPSPISELAGRGVSLGGIPDSYASTIGYTATVAALGMIAEAWNRGAIDPSWAALAGHVDELESALAPRADDLAAPFAAARAGDFVGGGPAAGSAEAGALLFRETVRLPGAAMSTRQYLHGAMESAGNTVHMLFGDEREIALAHTLASADHPVILVTSAEVADGPALQVVRVPEVPPSQRAILDAIVLQTLVARTAEHSGVDIEEFVFDNADTKVGAAL
ncbi:hypothetical protein GCM10022252_49070 [Streptosporangium oxazolinicum]|uniref:Glutamine--fructose-6-phosphate aminotransferase [isomerizing] n=1 Tax=Streptosporangium oxazolinicum TaxID=909287 RepID=A0ABP8B5V4_9ACTN